MLDLPAGQVRDLGDQESPQLDALLCCKLLEVDVSGSSEASNCIGLWHERRMIYAGVSSFFGFGLKDDDVPTFFCRVWS